MEVAPTNGSTKLLGTGITTLQQPGRWLSG